MRKALSMFAFFVMVAAVTAQTPGPVPSPTPAPFQDTSVSFNLTPLTLPGNKTSVAGAETDIMVNFTPNNAFGETNLINSEFTFAGGRYNRTFPSIATWLNNHSKSINWTQFQFGATGSLGVVYVGGGTPTHWGETAGGFVNYAINGTWGLGVDAEWANLPGYQHNTWKFAFSPSLHF